MKIVTYILAALLVVAIGFGAFFYSTTYQAMVADQESSKDVLKRATITLNKLRDKEARETAWISPALEEMKKTFADQINAGTVEVTAAGTSLVINIAEDILYTPHSVTFAGKNSLGMLQSLAASLANSNLKGKSIIIRNSTEAVPGRGKGKKKVLPRDARTLAADRSLALAKYLEQNKVEAQAIIAAAYGASVPGTGFKINERKTMVIIANPLSPSAAPVAAKPKPAGTSGPIAVRPAPASKPTGSAPGAQPVPKPIPATPIKPKGQ